MPLLATNEAKDSAFDRIYDFSFGHKKTIREGMVFIIYFEKSKKPLSGALFLIYPVFLPRIPDLPQVLSPCSRASQTSHR